MQKIIIKKNQQEFNQKLKYAVTSQPIKLLNFYNPVSLYNQMKSPQMLLLIVIKLFSYSGAVLYFGNKAIILAIVNTIINNMDWFIFC